MHTPTNSKRGIGQKKDVLWTNVAQHYPRHKLDGSAKHPTRFLETKCQNIKVVLGKFNAYYDTIKDLDDSRLMKDNNILNALALYKQKVGKNFVLKNCWVLLRTYPRFNIIFKPVSK